MHATILYNGREYDECLLPHIVAAYYEDELTNLPSAPDVGNYLIHEVDIGADI